MPKVSQRAILLRNLRYLRYTILVYGDAKDEADMDEFMELDVYIRQYRYLQPRVHRNDGDLAKCAARSMLEWLSTTGCDAMLYPFIKMRRSTFEFILSRIASMSMFRNRSKCPQTAVRFQLFVTLARLTSNGTAGSLDRESFHWGCGDGSVVLWTDRVLDALCRLEADYVQWPTAGERRQLSEWACEHHHQWQGHVVNGDGTHVYFHRQPAANLYPEVYWDHRHGGYGMNVMLIVDHHHVIRKYHVGWPGSASDSTVIKKSRLGKSPELYFSSGEYGFFDLGYALKWWCIVPYKGLDAQDDCNRRFNKLQRKGRVVVERTIGIWKNRFGSLKRLPLNIDEQSDFIRVQKWIRATMVLHNILAIARDPTFFEEAQPLQDDDENYVRPDGRNSTGVAIREAMKREMLAR